jgi:hypothetical protein
VAADDRRGERHVHRSLQELRGLLGADIPSGIGGPLGGGFGARLDPAVIVALVGWSIVELVILAILRIFTRADGA